MPQMYIDHPAKPNITETLELLGSIDVPSDVTELVFVGDDLFTLAAGSVCIYPEEMLLRPRSITPIDWLHGAEPVDAPPNAVDPGITPSHPRVSRNGVVCACQLRVVLIDDDGRRFLVFAPIDDPSAGGAVVRSRFLQRGLLGVGNPQRRIARHARSVAVGSDFGLQIRHIVGEIDEL